MSYGEANKENKENGGAMMETQKGNMEAIIRKVLFQDQRIRELSSAVAELQALRRSDLQQIAALQIALSESHVKVRQITSRCIEDAVAVAEQEAAEELYRRIPAVPALAELTLAKDGLLMLKKDLKPVPNWLESVVSLFPYGERKDEARSLGRRYLGDILASYTALGCCAGTAENVAKQFIYDLHLLPNEPPILSGDLGEEELTAAKRVASLALVDGLNKWMHQSHDNFQAIHGPVKTHQLMQTFNLDEYQRKGSVLDVVTRADDCQGCHVASSLDHLRVPPVLCTISEVLAHSLHPPTYVYPPPQPITAAYDYRPQSLPSYNQMHGIQNYDTSCYESRTSILSPHHHSNLRHKVHEQPPGNCKQQQLPYGHRSCDSVPLGLLNSKPLSCESLELNRSNSYFLLNTEVDMTNEVLGGTTVPRRQSLSSSVSSQRSVPLTTTPVRQSGSVGTAPTFRTPSVAERRLQRRKAEQLVSSASAASGLEYLGSNATPTTDYLTNSHRASEQQLDSSKAQQQLRSSLNQGLGLLLPLDYSGMEDVKASEMNILSEIDSTVVSAIRTRLESNNSLDTVLDVLVQYRSELADLSLPRPTTVDFDQALKDAKREIIYVNDRIFKGNAEKLMRRLQSLVLPLVGGKEEILASAVCKDIIRASSRTAGGGDAYIAVCSIFKRPNDGYLLAPKAAQSRPIIVVVDEERGEVCITVQNSFLLKHIPEDGVLSNVEENCCTQHEPRWKIYKQWVLTNFDTVLTMTRGGAGGGPKPDDGGGAKGGCNNNSSTSDLEPSDEVILDGCLMVHLSLLDGSCKRNLSVTSPLVEAASPQYIALGAGSSVVNGTYDLSGWYNGGPVYVNSVSGVSISVEELGEGRKGWVIGENLPSIIYYGNPGGVNRIRPPDLHWTFVAGGVGEDPPPTLMSSSGQAT